MITKRLLDICDFQGGTQPPKDEWINDPCEGYVRMLQIRDYSQGDAKFIQYVKDTKKLHKCKKDDIMLSRYGYIGQAFMGLEGAYNVALVKVIKKEEIHTPYLLYYFQSYYFQHFLLSNVGARATIPGFNKDELENALIRIPEMSEQVRIASKIAKIDELIGYHKQQLDVLDTLIKSRFIELFGDPVSNPFKWSTLTMKQAGIRLSDGPFGSNLKSEHYTLDGVRVIRLGNIGCGYFYDEDQSYISQEHYATIKKYTCRAGEIVIATLGDPNLRACIIPDYVEYGVNKSDCVHYIPKADILNNQFVCQYINCPETLSLASGMVHGQTRSRISSGQLADLPIYLPPMDLQQQFAAFVEQVDKSKYHGGFTYKTEVAA